jgi:hypothetical protein
VVDAVADEVKDATKHRGKIGAPRRAIKAGPASSNHAAETDQKEVNAVDSVLRGSEAKHRRKPRVARRMANAPREASVPNAENVPKEVHVLIEESEPSAASGLSAVNVRSAASAQSGLTVSAQSDPLQKGLDRKVAARVEADAVVAGATADRIAVRARGNQGHNLPGSQRRNRQTSSAT